MLQGQSPEEASAALASTAPAPDPRGPCHRNRADLTNSSISDQECPTPLSPPPKTSPKPEHDHTHHRHETISIDVRLDHHIFSKEEWKWARLRDHPRVSVTISLSQPGRTGSGAQSDLWSLCDFIACGFSRDELHPISVSLSAANHSPISIEGAFFAKLTTQSGSGEITSCHSMVYVSSSVKDMYLSYDSLLNLGLLPRTFPSLGDPTGTPPERETFDEQPHASRAFKRPEINTISPDATCSCPQRGAAPPRSSELPFPCRSENNAKMKLGFFFSFPLGPFVCFVTYCFAPIGFVLIFPFVCFIITRCLSPVNLWGSFYGSWA